MPSEIGGERAFVERLAGRTTPDVGGRTNPRGAEAALSKSAPFAAAATRALPLPGKPEGKDGEKQSPRVEQKQRGKAEAYHGDVSAGPQTTRKMPR